ncbi:MAG: hypothetical protein QHH14_07825 [Clostridiales bacterium]|nr:hypothetical protein [Clostridiales bacterium]
MISKKQRKAFKRLIGSLEKCFDENEGGTHCVFYTLLIRVRSLEKAYEKNPGLVGSYVTGKNIFLSKDGMISLCEMGFYFDEDLRILKELGLEQNKDFFLVDGDALCFREEELRDDFARVYSDISPYFDFIKLMEGHPVIRLKKGIETILDDDEKNRDYLELYFRSLSEKKEKEARRKFNEKKKIHQKEVLDKHKRNETIYGQDLVCFVHYEEMKVCLTCGEIFGDWRYEEEIGEIFPKYVSLSGHQKCTCKRDREEEKWPGFDFNEALTLCYGCGAELLISGSRWSVWFCESCKESVISFNSLLGSPLIPLGRHSIMTGIELPAASTHDENKIKQFVSQVNLLVDRIHLLLNWRQGLMKRNFASLGISGDILLTDYLFKADQEIPKIQNLQGMLAFFAQKI